MQIKIIQQPINASKISSFYLLSKSFKIFCSYILHSFILQNFQCMVLLFLKHFRFLFIQIFAYLPHLQMPKPVIQNDSFSIPQFSSQSFIHQSGEDLSVSQLFSNCVNQKRQPESFDSSFQQVQTQSQPLEQESIIETDFSEPGEQTGNKFRKISSDKTQLKKKKIKKPSLLLKVLCIVFLFLSVIIFGVFLQIDGQSKEARTQKLQIQVKSISQKKFSPTKLKQHSQSQNQPKPSSNPQIKDNDFIQAQKKSDIKLKNIQEEKENLNNREQIRKQKEFINKSKFQDHSSEINKEKQIAIPSDKYEQKNQKQNNQGIQKSKASNLQTNDDLKINQKQSHDKHQNSIRKTQNSMENQNATTKIQKNQKEFSSLSQQQKIDNNLPKSQTIQQTQTCESYIAKKLEIFGYLYQFINSHQDFRQLSNVSGLPYQYLTNLSEEQYSEAVDLMQLVHHGFQNATVQVTDTPCEKAQSVIKRLNETMQTQFSKLDQKYQIDSYHSKQMRFCIVTNSYRNAQRGLIYRNINSILQQNYTNYHVVYTDDGSPDLTGKRVLEYIRVRNVSEEKFKVKINKQKVGMMQNIYNAVTNDCKQSEIAVMLDGDDSFIGTNVLSVLNAVYQKQRVAMAWTNFVQILQNRRAMIGFSRDIDEQNKKDLHFRDPTKFVSSHLKSFHVDLFRKIDVKDLKHETGQFYGGASDTAMMICMIQMAFPYYRYVPEIMYEYRYDTGQVGMGVNRQAQLKAISKIIASSPYKQLKNLTFIDRGIQNVLKVEK